MKLERLLVGVDLAPGENASDALFSAGSLQAVAQARWLAERYGSELVFCSVIELTPGAAAVLAESDAGFDADTLHARVFAHVETLVSHADARGYSSSADVRSGLAWAALIEASSEHECDAILCGRPVESRIERLLFGSTTARLWERSPVPVWVVDRAATEDDEEPLSLTFATDGEVLDAADFDAELHRVITFAQEYSARLQLVHAVDDSFRHVRGPVALSSGQLELIEAQATDRDRRQLLDLLSMTDHRSLLYGLTVEVLCGDFLDVLHSAADSKQQAVVVTSGDRDQLRVWHRARSHDLQAAPPILVRWSAK